MIYFILLLLLSDIFKSSFMLHTVFKFILKNLYFLCIYEACFLSVFLTDCCFASQVPEALISAFWSWICLTPKQDLFPLPHRIPSTWLLGLYVMSQMFSVYFCIPLTLPCFVLPEILLSLFVNLCPLSFPMFSTVMKSLLFVFLGQYVGLGQLVCLFPVTLSPLLLLYFLSSSKSKFTSLFFY